MGELLIYLRFLLFLLISYPTHPTKESKYTAVYLSIKNETQRVSLLCLSPRFITYALPFILGKLSLEKTPLNLNS